MTLEFYTKKSPIDEIIEASIPKSSDQLNNLNDDCFDELLKYPYRQQITKKDFSDTIDIQIRRLFEKTNSYFQSNVTNSNINIPTGITKDINNVYQRKSYNQEEKSIENDFKNDIDQMKMQLTDIAKLDEMMSYLVEWHRNYQERFIERENKHNQRRSINDRSRKLRALSVYNELQEFCSNLLFSPNF